MPRILRVEDATTPSPSTPSQASFQFPDWAVFLTVLLGFLLLLFIVWLIYSWKTGLLKSGGAIGVPVLVPPSEDDEVIMFVITNLCSATSKIREIWHTEVKTGKNGLEAL